MKSNDAAFKAFHVTTKTSRPAFINSYYAFVLSLLILLSIAAITVDAGKKCPNSCDGNPVDASTPECELSLMSKLNGTICVWQITNVTGGLTFIVDDDVILAAGDVWIVKTHNNETIDVPSSLKGRRGVIFTNINDVRKESYVNVTLKLDDTSKDVQRVFGIKYSGPTFTLPVEAHHTYQIPLTPVPGPKSNALMNPKITLATKGPIRDDQLNVIEVEEIRGDVSYKFENIQSPEGFDAMAKDSKTPIEMSLTNFNYSTSRISFTAELVDRNCSGVMTDLSKELIFKPEVAGQSLNCLTLVNAKNPVRLDYSKLVQLLGPADILTIHSGGTEFQSPVLAVFNDQDIDDLKDKVRSQFSPSPKVRISYVSHFVSRPAGAPAISFKETKDSNIAILTNTSVQFKVTAGPDNLYLIQVPAGQRASWKLDKTVANPAAPLMFFSSSRASDSSPFLIFATGRVNPPVVVSPTNELRIVSTGSGVVDGQAGIWSAPDATAIGDSDSVIFKTPNLAPGASATWVIPSRSSENGSLALDINVLHLDAPDSCLEIKKLSNVEQSLVKECYKPEVSLSANQYVIIPTIVLHPNYVYTVTYTRGKESKTQVPILLSASISYSGVNGCSVDRKLGSGNLTITPSSYPNDAPVVDEELYKSVDPKDRCGWRLNATQGSYVHVMFQDLQLEGNQGLGLKWNGSGMNYNKSTIGIPDDVLAKDLLMLNLVTPLDNPSDVQHSSGKGFKVTVEEISCGGWIDADKVKQLSTPAFPKVIAANTTTSRCLWIVSGSKPLTILNMTKQFGSGGDVSNGQLMIYDNPHTRDIRFVNTTNATATYSSVNSVIVEYIVKDVKKETPGLQVNWEITECSKLWNGSARTCGDGKRCILPAWNCDGVNDCGDNFDEIHCNMTQPLPPPAPRPAEPSGGVSGWVIVFLIIPMSIGVGVLLTLFGPMLLTRLRGSRYSEFRNFATEDT